MKTINVNVGIISKQQNVSNGNKVSSQQSELDKPSKKSKRTTTKKNDGYNRRKNRGRGGSRKCCVCCV